MNLKIRLLIGVSAILACVARAQTQTPSIEQLQAQLQAMQQMVTNLQAQINDLKAQQQQPPPQAQPSTLASAAQAMGITNTPNGVLLVPPTITVAPPVSQVRPRETFRDYQESAQRPGSATLDPKFIGFIPIPNTPAFVKFNARVRADFTADTQNTGNPDRFVTAQIPVENEPTFGHGLQFNANSRASSLSVDVRAPDFPGDPRFYYDNDFFGGGTGVQAGYRLKQLWGQYYNFTAGFTFSIFEDPDVWPDTVDFEGPNSMIFARQATIRYMLALNDHWQVNFGIQQPASDIDTVNVPDVLPQNHAPDGGVNFRWEDKKIGHFQVAALLRDVGADSPTLGNQQVFGYGLMAAASINTCDKDSMQLQGTYGRGYFHYMNDNFTYSGFNGGDAAFDSSGDLKALQCYSGMVAYTHHWTEKWRSTVSGGYVHLENEASQGPLAYHKTFYGSANVIYQLRKRLSIGLEGLYGRKEVNDGSDGDVFRFQLGFNWRLFEQ